MSSEEGEEMMAERGAFERTTRMGGGIRDVGDVAAVFRAKILEQVGILKGINKLTDGDVENLIQNISKTPLAQYKNAAAYVLGYIGSHKGNDISPGTISEAMTCHSYLSFGAHENVTVEDVIRYAFFWKDVILKANFN